MASQVRGMAQTVAALRRFGVNAERLIEAETKATAIDIERDAKQRAPKNFGKLAQSISHLKISKTHYKVTVNELYGAYMEFGTGAKVVVPPEFAQMAATFKGQRGGTFEQGLESIKIWCRAKGIPENKAKWIFLKILGAGINPQPFLYPAYIAGKNNYKKRLEDLLKNFNRRI